MSKPWIKMTTDLRRHPKVVRMASALDADRLRTVGGLHAVWSVFDEHSEDGVLVGYSAQVLDDELRWPGFALAMAAVGWLKIADDRLELPEFDIHNGQSAKRRAQEADRKRCARASASDADKKRTRGEERREEKSIPPSRLSPTVQSADAEPEPEPRPPIAGSFEGHAPGTALAQPSPAAACAIALTRAGFRCTPLNPELLAYVEAGGSPEHLVAIAGFPECAGKAAGYVVKWARRELAQPAAALVVTPPTALAVTPTPARIGQRAAALLDLEALRREPDHA